MKQIRNTLPKKVWITFYDHTPLAGGVYMTKQDADTQKNDYNRIGEYVKVTPKIRLALKEKGIEV